MVVLFVRCVPPRTRRIFLCARASVAPTVPFAYSSPRRSRHNSALQRAAARSPVRVAPTALTLGAPSRRDDIAAPDPPLIRVSFWHARWLLRFGGAAP